MDEIYKMYSFKQFLLEKVMTFNDAIEIFGIDQVPASEKELNAIYKKLAIKYHPDLGGKTEDMARINAAKDILSKNLGKKSNGSNPSWEEKREQYKKDAEEIFDVFANSLKAINPTLYVAYFKEIFKEDFTSKVLKSNLENKRGVPYIEMEFANANRSTMFIFSIHCDVHSAVMAKQNGGSLGTSNTTYQYRYSSNAIVNNKKQVVTRETVFSKASGSLDFIDKPEFIFPEKRIKKFATGTVRKSSTLKKRDFESLFVTRFGGETFSNGAMVGWMNKVCDSEDGKQFCVVWSRNVWDRKAFYVIYIYEKGKYIAKMYPEQSALEQKNGGFNQWGWTENEATYNAFEELLNLIKTNKIKTINQFVKKYCELNRQIFEKKTD